MLLTSMELGATCREKQHNQLTLFLITGISLLIGILYHSCIYVRTVIYVRS